MARKPRSPRPPAEPPERPARSEGARRPIPFDPAKLARSTIALPLLELLHAEDERVRAGGETRALHKVIIDLNLEFRGGRDAARREVLTLIAQVVASTGAGDVPDAVNVPKTRYSHQYIFARLSGPAIREIVRLDEADRPRVVDGSSDAPPPENTWRAVYRIWPDFEVRAQLYKSLATVKADAARVAFTAMGDNIVWAVVDSGIVGTHPHFARHHNLDVKSPLAHMDFTGQNAPLTDPFGHGTHVAGIIAGEWRTDGPTEPGAAPPRSIRAVAHRIDQNNQPVLDRVDLDTISGIAPRARLLSLRVLDENGRGDASSLIAAIEYVQELNGYGRRLIVHGMNLSVGYDFEPEWFACGQSPLCVEVDRLVRSGVSVVAAAGNTGYGWLQSQFRGTVPSGLPLTINDPGNAELAITVGSAHREMPHIYGVSYFSSKGPTGDGRPKPDLVAPGEKVVSCAAGKHSAPGPDGSIPDYIEQSGTSMAAPHVSGVVAAFLSVRREFIGHPEQVKRIFCDTATDLRRDRYFQGAGMVDLMRAIQSI